MPLSPAKQRERRAEARKQNPAVFPRKKCDNCYKFFPQTHPKKRFCKNACKNEFWRNGGNAFGPLKIRLEKLCVETIERELPKLLAKFLQSEEFQTAIDERILANVPVIAEQLIRHRVDVTRMMVAQRAGLASPLGRAVVDTVLANKKRRRQA